MKTIEYRTTDKSGWGEGPWQTEPDKRQWQDEATGLPCMVRRSPGSGSWCGYVGLPEGHPLFGKDYDDVAAEVHGGLTFAGHCSSGNEASAICHIPDAGEPDHVWWLGFDCGHAFDLSPAYYDRHPSFSVIDDEVYRTIDYAADQCRALAKQLATA